MPWNGSCPPGKTAQKSCPGIPAVCEAAQEAASALQRSAAAKQVRLAVTGERALVNGARGLICEMIYNLCDNAIKYNVEGGSVEVLVAGGGAPRLE